MYRKELTESETLVMRCIWDADGEISVQEIIDNVEKTYGKAMKRTTASTFILKLRDKGYIEGRQDGRIMYYRPLIAEEEYIRSRSKDYLDFWYGGSLNRAVAMLCESAEMSPQQYERVKSLIDELE